MVSLPRQLFPLLCDPLFLLLTLLLRSYPLLPHLAVCIIFLSFEVWKLFNFGLVETIYDDVLSSWDVYSLDLALRSIEHEDYEKCVFGIF